MSNPGVLCLSNKNLSSGVNFRVEDNIGEAIHLHYGDELRLDLTVKELLSLESVLDNCIDELLKDTGFCHKNFDPGFLDMISQDLIELESVTIDTVRLSELQVLTKNYLGLPVLRNIEHSRIIKALNGEKKELEEYRQNNYRGQTNFDRVLSMKEHISKVGYPFDDLFIILFNDQNVVRDGQHRAACLYYLFGDREVPVLRMKFKNNFNNSKKYPWLDTLFSWNLSRIKRAIKYIVKKVIYLCRRIINKIKR